VELIDKVYRFVSLRPRSEKEIRDYLHGKHATDLDSEKIIQLLVKQKLLDDSAFVQWWLEQRATFRPKGKRVLRAELKQKGISEELIEEALNDGVDELILAKAAAAKKVKIYRSLPPREFRQKLSNFLGRKGFPWGIIKRVLDEEVEK
jgi:regulatory protein